ncbi:ASCH domain-containing protein [Candidatus Saccharibacteria bacterium]|nr:ASCH domain-containing protein [Candidatus Saccharibacteria bacterium]
MSYQVPPTTSVNDDEFIPNKNVIPFAPELVQFILDERKLTTYRFGKKYDYHQVGDLVEIQNSTTKEIVGQARILAKRSTTFEGVPVNTGTHESYRDKEHQRQVLSGYYAYIGREIADDDPFLIFDFALIK